MAQNGVNLSAFLKLYRFYEKPVSTTLSMLKSKKFYENLLENYKLYCFKIFLNVGSRLNRAAFNDMKKYFYVETFFHRN